MADKIYRMYGIEMAVELLRPKAKWEIHNDHFSRWDDTRPCPTMEEVLETMEKIKNFEDSVETIWLDEQIEGIKKEEEKLKKAFN